MTSASSRARRSAGGALRGEGVEAAAPDDWEPGEGEDGGFEEVPDGV